MEQNDRAHEVDIFLAHRWVLNFRGRRCQSHNVFRAVSSGTRSCNGGSDDFRPFVDHQSYGVNSFWRGEDDISGNRRTSRRQREHDSIEPSFWKWRALLVLARSEKGREDIASISSILKGLRVSRGTRAAGRSGPYLGFETGLEFVIQRISARRRAKVMEIIWVALDSGAETKT